MTWLRRSGFLLAALAATSCNVVLDCDETFNYWEPLHYLLYGDGLKPWEYEAQFALRPYLFLYSLYLPAVLMRLLGVPKPWIFRACKLVLAAANFWCLGLLCDFSLPALLAPGIFLQAPAFLPNSVACSLCAVALRSWQGRQTNRCLLLLAVTALLTWPYATVFYSPLALSVSHGKTVQFSFQLWRYLLTGLIAAVYIAIPVAVVDYWQYGVATASWWNAIAYNVVGGNDGRFGVESPHYYLLNGLLNYNFMFVVSALFGRGLEAACLLGSVVVLSLRGHKEERFLYPLIPLLVATFRRAAWDKKRLVTAAMAGLCALRLLAVKSYYGGPEQVFREHQFHNHDVVCFKDQWHRFPSHFFLHHHSRVGFLEAMDFDGALPQYYSTRYAVFNDKNRRSPTQFTDPARCTLFAGLRSEFPDHTAVRCKPMLDPGRTPAPFRWLYLPGGRVQWLDYCLFAK